MKGCRGADRRSPQAVPDEGIYYEVRSWQPCIIVCNLHRDVHALEGGKLMTRSFTKLGGWRCHPYPDPGSPGVKPTGARQATASVAARSRQHQRLATSRVTIQKAAPGKVRQVSAGVLHHLDEADVVLFDH